MADDTKRGVFIIAGVNEALKYRSQHPKSSDEQVMKSIMKFLENPKLKNYQVDIIVGVTKALKILISEPGIKDKEVIDRIMKEIPTMIVEN